MRVYIEARVQDVFQDIHFVCENNVINLSLSRPTFWQQPTAVALSARIRLGKPVWRTLSEAG